jgi:Peptidase family C25/Propeptide_C25
MKKYENTVRETSKVIFILVMLIITPFSCMVIASHQQPADSISMTYLFPSPTFSKISIKNDVYDQILLQNAPCSGNPGEPFLPTKGVYLLLPPNTKVDTITINGEKTFVGTGFKIVPCGKSIPLTPHTVNEIPTPDKAIYTSDTIFPSRLFSEVGVYQFRGYSILVLMLYPVQYIPLTGDLFYYPTMIVTVNLTKETFENSLYRSFPQDYNELLTKIDNPAVGNTYQQLLPHKMVSDQFDLMILTTDTLKSSFIPLAEQHKITGTRTIIRTLSDVGGNTPENIRDYIRTVYTTLGIRYVLLGGDADIVPAKMLWVQGMDENITAYETEMPVDLYYACLDGTYNYDGDEKWGEPHDGENGSDVDLIAEVYVGRACVDNTDEVDNFVQKTVEYLSLSPGETYLGDATFAGEYLGDYGIASFGGTTLNQLINRSSENGFTTVGIPASSYIIDKLYDESYPGFDPNNPWGTGWPKEEIINRINNGVHLINHDGHANYEYNMRMNTDDANGLTNNDNYCFVYSQGCMSGGFDNPDGGDCIAEYFTVKNTHGAFAGIWNARYGFFWSYSTDGDSQRYHRQLWDAVFGENIKEIGRANHDSKEDNLFLIQRSCMRWCYYETNLFGDPAVAFLNASGQKPSLRISAMNGGMGVVQASIVNEGEVPVSNIPWSISISGGLFGFINMSSEGSLASLMVGNTTTVQQDKTIFGFGKISIQVNVKYAEEWNGMGFVLGPFVLRVIRIC